MKTPTFNHGALWIASALAPCTPMAWAQSSLAHQKHAYTLLNPTPRDLMRELSADRPDVTESPYTVDAGHIQIEMSFVDYVREGGSNSLTVAPMNIKLGVLNNTDVQLVIDPYVIEQNGQRAEGFGDTQLRAKVNLWGNDEGRSALALMPYIKLPTASDEIGNDEVEGGLIVPFATQLADGWSLSLMAEFDGVYDPADDNYDLEFLYTVALGHDITDRLGGYVEYIGIASTDSESDYRGLIGMGVTFAVTEDFQLDGGVNFGLTDAADDFNPFIGMTVRF
ncbi:MAG: transporter [Phycisphaerales bacterium]|nr:transporter [Phycisphaerales bacterium]MCI0631929.1 transporter [Phycisphaerales bacterium]MCI0676199.1 transporter [Phycisphaerales bacterium]